MAMSIASSMPCASTALRKPMSPSSPPSSEATVSWPPVGRADGIRRAGVSGIRLESVVAPLAVRSPDRVDRREVDDVEAHRRDVGKAPLGLGEGRGDRPLRIAALGARKQLVPRTESSPLAVDDEPELRRSRCEAPVGVTAHGRQYLVGVERRDAAGRRSGAAQGCQRGAEDAQVVGRLSALGSGKGGLDEDPPLLDLRRDRHAGLDLLVQPLPPAAIAVAPGLDRVPVPPVAGELDVARPSVVLDRPHRRLVPGLLVVGTHEERGVEQVVAVGDDVGRDEQLIADDALDRVSAAVELGADPLDHDPAPRADLAGFGLARVGHGLRHAPSTLLHRRHGCGATLPDRPPCIR